MNTEQNALTGDTSCAPKTLEEQIAFIRGQYPEPLAPAYFLEIEIEGSYEVMTLSAETLWKKKKELGFDEYGNFQGNGKEPYLNYGLEDSRVLYWCDITGKLLGGGDHFSINEMTVELDGFAWRRMNRLQMEEADWREAKAFISVLTPTHYHENEGDARKLLELIVTSCFLEPVRLNDTGLHSPGSRCYAKLSELVRLFEEVHAVQPSS